MVSSFAQQELIIYLREALKSIQKTIRTCALEALDDSNESTQLFVRHIELNIPTESAVETLVQNCNVSYAALNISTENFRKKAKVFVVCCENQNVKWANTLERTFGKDALGRNFKTIFIMMFQK